MFESLNNNSTTILITNADDIPKLSISKIVQEQSQSPSTHCLCVAHFLVWASLNLAAGRSHYEDW